jgi:hypothetical protein
MCNPCAAFSYLDVGTRCSCKGRVGALLLRAYRVYCGGM